MATPQIVRACAHDHRLYRNVSSLLSAAVLIALMCVLALVLP
jgi:hypothetical protein